MTPNDNQTAIQGGDRLQHKTMFAENTQNLTIDHKVHFGRSLS